MVARQDDSRRSVPHARHIWSVMLRRTLWAILCLTAVATSGCGGCDSDPATQQPNQQKEYAKKKKNTKDEKKKKPPIEIGTLLPQLGEPPPVDQQTESADGSRGPKILVKPGHWTPTVQKMKANYEDFVGNSQTMLLDKNGQSPVLQNTRYTFQSARPVVLAKGQAKLVEGELFVPEHTTGQQVRARLTSRATGGEIRSPDLKLAKMPSYQYFVVVLAEEVSRYGFLKVTDAVRAPWEEEFEAASAPHYRVVLADATKRISLSDNVLTWTNIAYLVWDQVDPTRLSAGQQEALVDWLHWGGRIIINGPDSLNTLRGSFLEDFLPADDGGPRQITADDLQPWSAYWSDRQDGKQVPPLAPKRPWSGITLLPRAEARELQGGAQLFFERDVGRGSVVVSAVQLAQRDLINWPGYDSFLNAGLLRRPRRRFTEGAYGGLRIDWDNYPERRLDAHLTTGLRLFARDAATKANWQRIETSAASRFGVVDTTVTQKVDRPGGIAAWSEESPVSLAARHALEKAAAVRVPGAGFVVACLAVYLLVLVPLNWMVFRTLRRVEWAWIAAPVIAILGTWTIVRLVQLDIGFVRSQTEIALLELQGPYQRGLLSRYTAFYSSLSTTYDIAFDDPTTVALPFPTRENDPLKLGDSSSKVVLDKQRETHLSGLTVSSASRRNVRSEQMFSLKGPLQLGKSSRGHEQVENHTGFDLRDVVVVHRSFKSGQPRFQGTWIGELRNKDSAVLGLTVVELAKGHIPYADQRKRAAREAITERLGVGELMKIAFQFPDEKDPLYGKREEVRLVGIIDQVLPGAQVAPAASQIRGATVVLAHLQYGAPPKPEPDANSRTDVLKE